MVELTFVLGSTSDWKNENIRQGIKKATQQHDDLRVRVVFASAHNTPDRVPSVLGKGRARLSGAGMSAALPGIVEACYCDLEHVSIGVPVSDKYWGGLPAFLSIAEMPPNNPVICTGVNNVAAAMHIGYVLETKQFDDVALVRLHYGCHEGYERIKAKLDDLLGTDERGKPGYEEIGEVDYVRGDNPAVLSGRFVIGVYQHADLWNNAAFRIIDTLLLETGGLQIVVKEGAIKDAFNYMDQFKNCEATGTVAVGSAGYTNAAQLAVRILGDEKGMQNIAEIKAKKVKSLEISPVYYVEKGEIREIA
jgi:phosphoribosylcarboxyaminoimidazole (NCAIR) mutase